MKRLVTMLAFAGAMSMLLTTQRSWSDDEPKEERKPVPRADGEGRGPPPIRRDGDERTPRGKEEARREGADRKPVRPDGEDRPLQGRDGERREGDARANPPPRGDQRPMGPPRDEDFRNGPPRMTRDGGPPMGPPHDMERMKEQDPEMFALVEKDHDLERKTVDLSQKLHRATPSERQKMREEVKTLVGEHFAVRQQRRQLQFKRMEEDLKRLRDSVENREKQKDDIIQRRVDELLGNESDRGF